MEPDVRYRIQKCPLLVPILSAFVITQEESNFYDGMC